MELQASEWEQEIMQLRTQLELLEQEHSCSLEQSNIDWSSRLDFLQEELEQERELRKAAEQGRVELEERLKNQNKKLERKDEESNSSPSLSSGTAPGNDENTNPEQYVSSPELRDSKVWGRDIPTFIPHTPTLTSQVRYIYSTKHLIIFILFGFLKSVVPGSQFVTN